MTTPNKDKKMAATNAKPDELRGKPSLSMIALLVVEMIVGYEWLISGLTKFVRGDFPSGLAAELLDKSAGALGWYVSFLNGIVISNATFFGYFIETVELLAGIALIVGPLIWLFAWGRVSDRVQAGVIFFIAAASISGIFMAINFHLANGNSHPWLLPNSGFDEGIDLDSILPAIQLVIATVNIIFFSRFQQQKTNTVAIAPQSKQSA